jgi:hypothetical protein
LSARATPTAHCGLPLLSTPAAAAAVGETDVATVPKPSVDPIQLSSFFVSRGEPLDWKADAASRRARGLLSTPAASPDLSLGDGRDHWRDKGVPITAATSTPMVSAPAVRRVGARAARCFLTFLSSGDGRHGAGIDYDSSKIVRGL